ncbi:cell wall hydrolase [Porphyrobacter sp. ULC335]|uniref:cell wall hydrolase n=1 Tax=Porphyrobacter sp. ULC335 TaxID=2854260 RepID=UPI002220BE5F|nr:cell wall hydrolase [Porphyrobacter sp. ULC335]UYV16287.1 cell wall hydrolase [Porphyrobacter sp. ULC335]
MSRKTTTIAAIAAVAFATTMFPSGRNAAALAQAATDQLTAPVTVDAPELVPDSITYIAQEVVQPLADATPAAATLTEAGSLSELVGMVDTDAALDEQMRCLAGAVYFEARGEPLAGQLAVAQVIINRTEDGRFPRSYCGVVAQPGQFSFMRGRHMPQVREGSAAWNRAVAVAQIAHKGLWESEAGNAVFFHARYVRPGWSHTKTRLAQIDTHIFYR